MLFLRWFFDLWYDPLYQFILIIIFIEVTFLLFMLFLLIVQAIKKNWVTYKGNKFYRELGSIFLESLESDEDIRKWIAMGKAYPESVLREFFQSYLKTVEGDYREKIVTIYRSFGFHKKDLKYLRSPFWNRRLIALRRLSKIALPEDREIIVRNPDPRPTFRVLAARILVDIGSAEDIFQLLKNQQMPKRLMEQPLYSIFKGIPPETFVKLMDRWKDFESPIIRRILLITASQIIPSISETWVDEASKEESIEMRIGACIASSQLGSDRTIKLLLNLLDDPEWAVRAQAAKALGKRRSDLAITNLAKALSDPSYWVRQNAAAALSSLGTMGRKKLESVSEEDPDPFARDAAKQELQRYRLNLLLGVAPA